MKSLLIVLFGSYLLFTFGIASAAYYNLDVTYGESAGKGYYIVVSKSNDKWIIKEISDKASKRKNENEEVLFVNEGIDYIMPVFEKDACWKHRGGLAFKCDVGSGKNKQKYTPCNSELTIFSRTDFFFLAGGTTYVLMEDRISALVKETALIPKIKELQKKMKTDALAEGEGENSASQGTRAPSMSKDNEPGNLPKQDKQVGAKKIGIIVTNSDPREGLGSRKIQSSIITWDQPFSLRDRGASPRLNGIIPAVNSKLNKEYNEWCKEHSCQILKLMDKSLADLGYDVNIKKQPSETPGLTLMEKKRYPLTIKLTTYSAELKHIGVPDYSDPNLFGIGKYKFSGIFMIAVRVEADILNSMTGEVIDRIQFQKKYESQDDYNLVVDQQFSKFEIIEDTRGVRLKTLLDDFYPDLVRLFASYKYDEAHNLIANK